MIQAHYLIEGLDSETAGRILDVLLEGAEGLGQPDREKITQFIARVSHELGNDCLAVRQLRKLIAVDDLGVV